MATPSPRNGPHKTLEVVNFGQIAEAKIEFRDLTVLVGPQAAGKSLLLQWWKLVIDSGEIVLRLPP